MVTRQNNVTPEQWGKYLRATWYGSMQWTIFFGCSSLSICINRMLQAGKPVDASMVTIECRVNHRFIGQDLRSRRSGGCPLYAENSSGKTCLDWSEKRCNVRYKMREARGKGSSSGPYEAHPRQQLSSGADLTAFEVISDAARVLLEAMAWIQAQKEG